MQEHKTPIAMESKQNSNQQNTNKQSTQIGYAGLCGIAILVFIVWNLIASNMPHDDQTSISAAQNQILSYVLDKSSVNFCNNDKVTKDSNGDYIVTGYVDAVNIINGNDVRANYQVIVDSNNNILVVWINGIEFKVNNLRFFSIPILMLAHLR